MPPSAGQIANMSFTSRYPITVEQYVTIAVAALLPLALGVFMATSSGKPAWWSVVALAPVTGWLAWRENDSRKRKAGVSITVKDGSLTCKHAVIDPQSTQVDLTKVDYVSFVDISNRKYIVVAEDDGNSDNRVRIPVRAFTPGNPVGPMIRTAVENNGGTVPAPAAHYLDR